MSEVKIPEFMQAYLDNLNDDSAYPKFMKLAKEYAETLARVNNNAGYYAGKLNILRNAQNRIKLEFDEKAKNVAQTHELTDTEPQEKSSKGPPSEKQSLSKEEKLAQMKENFVPEKKEDQKSTEIGNDGDEPPPGNTPTAQPVPITEPDFESETQYKSLADEKRQEEIKQLAAQIKASREQHRGHDRER